MDRHLGKSPGVGPLSLWHGFHGLSRIYFNSPLRLRGSEGKCLSLTGVDSHEALNVKLLKSFKIMGRTKFSRSLKRSICIEYMQSGKSRKEIAMKYNLPSVGTLSGWINSCLSPLEIHEKCASLQPVTVQMDSGMAKEKNEKPMDVAAMSALIEAQRKQIEKLEKQLKYSQDKNLALNTLIDVIEEQGIKVRKKAGVKQ